MVETYRITATLLVVTLFSVTVTAISGSSRRVHEEHIVIVGAGAAGIAAASRLLENGVDNFVIVEAGHRFGGQINAVKFGDNIVDLGAHWVHGENENIVFEMGNKYDLLINYKADNPVFIDSSGNVVNNDTASELYYLLYNISNDASEELKKENSPISLGEYVIGRYQKRLSKSTLKDSNLAQPFLNWYEKAQGTEDGSESWFKTSGHGYAEYEELDGDQSWDWRSGTYATVLDLLMKTIPDSSKELPVKQKIHYGSNVHTIKWNNLPKEMSKKIMVLCSDGTTYIADHVILTVGLGVLKETANSMFQPELPAKKLTAIRGLGFGTVDKIYMKFPHKWWPDGHTEFDFLWTTDDTCNAASQSNIAEDKQADCWHQQVFAFEEVQPLRTVLVGWVSGSASYYMEKLNNYDVKEKMLQLLNRFVGTAFNVTIPPPEHFLRSKWNSNPHFRGSYSFRSMETEKLRTSAADLAEPVINDNGNIVLLFAGEATHSSHYSTVHGAIESGWREAERILKL